jgi:mRNA interferase RelE/StbE
MLYAVEYTPAALRDLERLDPFICKKLVADIDKLAGNPRPQGFKQLDTKEKFFRVQIGPRKDYRVIYQIRDAALVVLVARVGDRKEVYRKLR